MNMFITLAGPQAAEDIARQALAESGFDILEDFDHCLPQEPGVAFVSCEGHDIDVAAACVAPYGYRLRLHESPVVNAVVMPVSALPVAGGDC
jgi:hypothetical protein